LGERDGLVSPVIDLVNEPDATLSFDLAYAQFAGYVDTLAVYVSTDCGVTYDPAPVYIKYGNQLETISFSGSFTPSALSDWRRETADLSSYVGNQVVLKVLGTTGYGNNLYIDNINVYSSNTLPAIEFMANNTSISCNGTSETIEFYDLSLFNPTIWTWTFSPSTVSFVNGTNSNSQNPQVQFNDYGTYSVTLVVGNNVGNEFLSKQDYIVIEQSAVTPFEEAFENQLIPPDRWQLVNPDNDKTWDISLTASGNGSGIASAYIYNYSYYAPGETDELISPAIDLNGLADASLSFNMAYRMYSSSYNDSLKIFISTDCGDSYEVNPIYSKGGPSLETSPGSGSSFTPSQAGDWRNELVDLTAHVGSSIVLKFQAINDYGNNLFLDDINLTSTGFVPIANFNSSLPNWVECSGPSHTIDLYSTSVNNPTSWSWQITPSSYAFVNGTNSFSENPQIQFASLGSYDVQLTAINVNGSHSIGKTIIIDLVEAGFDLPNDPLYEGVPATLYNTGSGSNAWNWDFGDGVSSNMENPTYTYSVPGQYTISQVVQNTVSGCMDSISQDVMVEPFISGVDPAGWENIRVLPVPSDGLFTIDFNQFLPGNVWLSVYNLVGQQIYNDEIHVAKPGSYPVDISGHPKGVYMVRVITSSADPTSPGLFERSFIMVIE
jgi:PKD repeat protein